MKLVLLNFTYVYSFNLTQTNRWQIIVKSLKFADKALEKVVAFSSKFILLKIIFLRFITSLNTKKKIQKFRENSKLQLPESRSFEIKIRIRKVDFRISHSLTNTFLNVIMESK